MAFQVIDVLLVGTIQGRNGVGTISLPGTRVGDVVFIVNSGNLNNATAYFENTISVDDEIQQTLAADLSSPHAPIGPAYLFRSIAT